MTILLNDEAAQVAFGRWLGQTLAGRGLVFLEGELGAGKTTMTRGILSAYGHDGAVKSPTYTLMEPYELDSARIYHFDLYRLGDPEELEFLGARDVLGDGECLKLVEWPSRGEGWLASPDITVTLDVMDEGRRATLSASSDYGRDVLEALSKPR
ncbi:tRNA (adenosine(37)-N6)-threonylcarbamoyltransferase complex ATPase subunit type 1 TsaE [Larsenimonas salina]|uniref:tRNA (adenosine(37)-N6)-threonylcarbamoyltransferase complex ATPase subunit type 1 TsaE n=1 Tax=Larsenimonas salina TaxID=1295565 RepID=UPI00207459DF|nr:tRNA (adenosine(37)-N6)-threonylcarbamoyltransferase complex ATPase subunit type 1 TsaE [Larsenimonas salina]MCM5704806.1 tRNA (adenosine(37)-N6)-threonylcarbamoyltransferase complex ATPase subunit type 1 TsaE [Larsenimonas salina]